MNFHELYKVPIGISTFYKSLFEQGCNINVSEVYEAIERGEITKQLLYLTLLIKCPLDEALKDLIEYETSLLLDITNSTTLFTCLINKKHWFESLIETENTTFLQNNEISNAFKLIQLIYCLEAKQCNFEQLQQLLNKIVGSSENLSNIFISDVKHTLNLVHFCGKKADFNFINEHSALKSISQFINLNEEFHWKDVTSKLHDSDRFLKIYEQNSENLSEKQPEDVEIFACFKILATILNFIKADDQIDLPMVLEQLNAFLNEIKNDLLFIEVLENIFSLCFLKREENFICGVKHVRTIILFLKQIFGKPRQNMIKVRYERLKDYISDAFWRMEMIDGDVRSMLSNHEALIANCMEKDDFQRAHQVLKIYDLYESRSGVEILKTEKLIKLRNEMKKVIKWREYSKLTPTLRNPTGVSSPVELLQRFFKESRKIGRPIKWDDSEDESEFTPMDESFRFEEIFDFAVTTLTDYAGVKELLDYALENRHNESGYFDEIVERYEILAKGTDKSLPDILNDPFNDGDYFRLNFIETLDEFNEALSRNEINSFNCKNELHKIFLKLNDIVGNDKNGIRYFLRLFNYLRSLLVVFQTSGDHTSLLLGKGATSLFKILDFSRTDIVRFLVYVKKVDPMDLESFFTKMKLDLVYHTAANCFPRILLQYDEYLDETIAEQPTHDVLAYIGKRNWLLGYILRELFDADDAEYEINEERIRCFVNFTNLLEIHFLKSLYSGNVTMAALRSDYLKSYFEYIGQNEVFEQINDEAGNYNNWRYLFDVLESLPEYQKRHFAEYMKIRDTVLSNLIGDRYKPEIYNYLQYISSDELRLSVIFANYKNWPGDFCVMLLKLETSRLKNQHGYELEEWLTRIQFCEELKNILSFSNWYIVHEYCSTKQENMMRFILRIPKIQFMLDFIRLYKPQHFESYVSSLYIKNVLENMQDFANIEKLLQKLPMSQAEMICNELIKSLKHIEHIEFILKYISDSLPNSIININNVRFGCLILSHLSQADQEQFHRLISNPIDIIEMLVMNTKLEKLGFVMATLRNTLPDCSNEENDLTLEKIDAVLRHYSEKSLEFRMILEPRVNDDDAILQTLDSIYDPDRLDFIMPEQTPLKSEWVPNNEVIECMCCRTTMFSMFNRRHHCRRCGRVVCFNCSSRRLLVEHYGNIRVRVCDDCYTQTNKADRSDTASSKSIIYDYWLLTDDAEHNAIVRQEFAYENAPSVSLCLSIMRHHSISIEHPKFLLEQCDQMIRLIQPTPPNGSREIDYFLIIRMLKSLAMATNILASECNLKWGTSQAEKILIQADLLGLLVDRDCLRLIPSRRRTGRPYVDAVVLRKLREALLEKEQWDFALDVSTKAALDATAVFAAWGQSCLRSGDLSLAREKFRRCFDRGSEANSGKNIPLLNKIVGILESHTVKVKKSDGIEAICVRAKLNSLNAIAEGRLNISGGLDPVFFEECVYYLSRYGTHGRILEFYIKHGCTKNALQYVIDNDVNIESFTEMYVSALKSGNIVDFQQIMKSIDPSLVIWKEYIREISRYFYKNHLLNSLYQMQKFIDDWVRASMTCIMFYRDRIKSYSELYSNLHHLYKSMEHITHVIENPINEDELSPFRMKMDERLLTLQLFTIKQQIWLTKFIQQNQIHSNYADQIIPNLLTAVADLDETYQSCSNTTTTIPTLFDSGINRTKLAILSLIVSDNNIEEGYEFSSRIIQEYKLNASTIISRAGYILVNERRFLTVTRLVTCVKSDVSNSGGVIDACDDFLAYAIKSFVLNGDKESSVDSLIKLIADKAIKISMFIVTKQLISAYILAAKLKRCEDIKRILQVSECIEKNEVKIMCEKYLETHTNDFK